MRYEHTRTHVGYRTLVIRNEATPKNKTYRCPFDWDLLEALTHLVNRLLATHPEVRDLHRVLEANQTRHVLSEQYTVHCVQYLIRINNQDRVNKIYKFYTQSPAAHGHLNYLHFITSS